MNRNALFSPPLPALRRAGESGHALGSYGMQDTVGNRGFSLGLLLLMPSVPGTVRKADDLNWLCARTASFYFPLGKDICRGVKVFRSQIFLGRSQLKSFYLFNSEEWKQPRGSITFCATTAVNSTMGIKKAQRNFN